MQAKCYLVITRKNKRVNHATVVRVTQRRPSLDSNEAFIKVVLEIPDDAFDSPLVTLPVEKKHLTVAAEAEEAA